MAERQVSIGGQTHPLPEPFIVIATQNPIESEGVYPLPEAQRDRFLMKVDVALPARAEEFEILQPDERRPAAAPGGARPGHDPRAAASGRPDLRARRSSPTTSSGW